VEVTVPDPEVQARALALRFRHWDRDHSGHLELSDLKTSARRLGEAFGRAANAPEQLALEESCRQLWEILARHADVDHDGRISEDEFIAAFTEEVLADPAEFDRVYRILLENVVEVADADGNGKLDEGEYVRLMGSWYSAGESDAVAAFANLDRDNDGFLTLEELVRSAMEFYHGESPALEAFPTTR
jgi:Ca2+-binding EF-hand superfamily protein